MILLHIITNNENQAIEISDYLIDQKLILDAVTLEPVSVRKRSSEGKFQTAKQVLIIGKTKSLLFDFIDKQLRKKYPDNMPVLYSLAIVNMDWEQADLLINKTAKV